MAEDPELFRNFTDANNSMEASEDKGALEANPTNDLFFAKPCCACAAENKRRAGTGCGGYKGFTPMGYKGGGGGFVVQSSKLKVESVGSDRLKPALRTAPIRQAEACTTRYPT